ncbi:MAG: ATP-binding protein [Desulfosarcinaceae bacterium]
MLVAKTPTVSFINGRIGSKNKELDLISPSLDFKTEEAFYEEACRTLPRMTAFFVEELNTSRVRPVGGKGYRTSRHIFSRIVPGRQSPATFELDHANGDERIQGLPIREFFPAEQSANRQRVIQTLINGISNHFSDLIMGIWGNASLIRLHLDQDHPSYERVVRLEKMIQEGAYLIQLILGYLGERRSAGKAIRLNHLVHQIGCYLPDQQNTKALSGRLHWSAIAQQPRLMAGATAHIIEMLLSGIETFRRNIVLDTLEIPVIQQRIGIIAALVKKGEMITSQLMCYSGDVVVHKKWNNLKTIILRQHRRFRERYANITIQTTLTPRLPRILLDQKKIEWVVAQMIENAAEAVPDEGKISLTLKPMYAEDPQQRCGVHAGRDYIVLTIENSGAGISPVCQSRIFDPFYTHPASRKRLGLGLSAANGIIRKHGGYIQVRSRHGQGGRFKIYLPLRG